MSLFWGTKCAVSVQLIHSNTPKWSCLRSTRNLETLRSLPPLVHYLLLQALDSNLPPSERHDISTGNRDCYYPPTKICQLSSVASCMCIPASYVPTRCLYCYFNGFWEPELLRYPIMCSWHPIRTTSNRNRCS
jgi:hypothetical protein